VAFDVLGVFIDIVYSWIRMLIALAVSILFSIAIGILAARNKRAESIIIPLLDVFQSIPILGFFPIVIAAFIGVFPAPSLIGVNLAVIFLIFTSMSWNIAFGVYEAVKSIPQDYIDLSQVTNTGTWGRIKSLYIPASLSRIAYNTQTSWAVGLFYLVASEILTVGSQNNKPVTYTAGRGIAITITSYAKAGDWTGYTYSIIALIVAVAVWQVIFLREFSLWSERYKFVEDAKGHSKDPLLKLYEWVNHRSISKLFLLTHDRGVTKFSSTIYRFRKTLVYTVLILFIALILLQIGDIITAATTGFSQLPTLSEVAGAEGNVLISLLFSFARIWYVYLICTAVALPLGIVIALHPRLYETLTPVLEVVASVPAPALLPVIVILAANQAEGVAAIIIFLGMIWYIIFNVMAGIRTLPSELWELRRVFHLSSLQAWRDIYLPASLTAFVTGSITAVGAAWNTLIVAEFFSSGKTTTQVTFGIGKVIAENTYGGHLWIAYLAIISMTVLVITFNLTVWRRVYHYTTSRYVYNR
jgi:NitT/TauT family transport system permease protein